MHAEELTEHYKQISRRLNPMPPHVVVIPTREPEPETGPKEPTLCDRAVARLSLIPHRGQIYAAICAAAEHFDVDINLFNSECHSKKRGNGRICRARHVAVYVAHMRGYGISELGRAFNRDHSSSFNSIQRVRKLLITDDAIAADVKAVEDRLAEYERMAGARNV